MGGREQENVSATTRRGTARRARGPAAGSAPTAQRCLWLRVPGSCRHHLPLGQPDPRRQRGAVLWMGWWELREGGPAGAFQPQGADCPELPVGLDHTPSCRQCLSSEGGCCRPQLCLQPDVGEKSHQGGPAGGPQSSRSRGQEQAHLLALLRGARSPGPGEGCG